MRAYGPVVLGAALLLSLTGCSAGDRPATPPTPMTVSSSATASPTPTAAPPITPAQALAEFTEFARANVWVREAGLMRDALEQVTGGQSSLTAAAFDSAGGRPAAYRWGEPTLLVPRLAPGDKNPWFSAIVPRDGKPTLVTFARGGGRWRLTSMTVLRKVPQVEIGADGYATPLASDDVSVRISPKYVGPLHATIAEAGSEGVAGKLIAPGPFTTEIAESDARDRAMWRDRAYDNDSTFSTGDLPVYALRTKDGGALVQYSLTRTTTVTPKTTGEEGVPIPVPERARWAVGDVVKPTRLKPLSVSEVHQFATAVPPADAEHPADVVAHDGGVIKASGPTG
ncbi:hypothetical protein [Nonomuraea sp. NPDC050310]|uniref:hypothetical protein n=1 Tax=unclassified Nonomuraea TaxID=2593643 RepID=UPI0033E49CFB